jgi:cytochrome c oxidase assembly factor CtaG
MQFWCSALKEPWSWAWRPYVGVWILCLGLLTAYAVAVRRRRHTNPAEPDAGKRALWFALGVLAIWVASDWPVGLLGSSYLSSVHMAQYMLYTLAAAPLLILGVPEWMARRLLGKLRLYRTVRFLARPLVAAALFNAILIATNVPLVVDALRGSQVGSFALDMTWLLSGLILWMPICCAIPEISGRSYPVKMVYLFLAAATVPMVPGGFLTFADHPLYATYELAPRVMGFSALNDQQLAGAFMKVGNIPVIWSVIAVMFVRWWKQERASDVVLAKDRPTGRGGYAAPGSAQRHPGTGYAPARAPKPAPPDPSPNA